MLHTARTGEVRLHYPRTGRNTPAADVPVYQHDEEGLQASAPTRVPTGPLRREDAGGRDRETRQPVAWIRGALGG